MLMTLDMNVLQESWSRRVEIETETFCDYNLPCSILP
jgi:hypothetical protein